MKASDFPFKKNTVTTLLVLLVFFPFWRGTSLVRIVEVTKNTRLMVCSYLQIQKEKHFKLIRDIIDLDIYLQIELLTYSSTDLSHGSWQLRKFSPHSAGTLPACYSLFQLILSHRTLLNHSKPSEIHCALYQPNTVFIYNLDMGFLCV